MKNKSDIKNWRTIGICGIDCYQPHIEVKAVIEDLFGETYILAVSNPDNKPHKVKIVMNDYDDDEYILFVVNYIWGE